MKHNYISAILVSMALTGAFSSCSDFLDKQPLSDGTEAVFFTSATQFDQAANDLYKVEGWKNYNGAAIYNAGGMDIGMDTYGLGTNGGGSAVEDDWHWDKPYSYIRGCNILLSKAETYGGDKNDATWKNAVGTAYFFRAWQYFYLLKYFGGVPIIDKPLDLNSEELYGPRKSRYEVINFIISDLEKAIPLLNDASAATPNDGKVHKQVAQAFLARVCLYEGTWDKYVPTIGYDLDGDGKETGAGAAKPQGYPSVKELLTKAKDNAKAVMDAGKYELWNQCDSLSYYYLFSIDEKGGNMSNFKNAGKATNKEFIFSAKYDFDVARGGVNLGHTTVTGLAGRISGIFGRSFLCRNGLPIRISYTGDMKDAQNNPEYDGVAKSFIGEFRNRDYRFIGCAALPDRVHWTSQKEYGLANTTGKPYPDPVYPKVPYDPKDEAFSNKTTIYTPTLLGGGNFDGYGNYKFQPEGANRADKQESADFPLIRLAEVYLIYAEATCELGNGTISDNDLNISLNKVRARAGVAPLTNALIANVWDAGWWDHKQNKTVCHKMNMLDEIRRERTCELFSEGFRADDLKRWGIAQYNLTGQKLGRQVYNSAYMTNVANDATFHGQKCYQEDTKPLQYGVYGDANHAASPSDPDYGRSIATLKANLLFSQRDYLNPIPRTQIRLNPELKQNPGW